MNYESLQGLSKTQNKRYELTGFLIVTKVANVEALGKIIDSESFNYESIYNVAKAAITNYESLVLSTLTKDKRYELLGIVQAEKAATIESLQYVDGDSNVEFESLKTVYPKKSPKIIIARKSSSDSGDPAAYSRLSVRGYDVTLNLSATVADCRAYDIVIIDCEFWSADEHNTFIQDLWNDGQKVVVTGNDTNDLFYQTGNTVLLNAPNIGATQAADGASHEILDGWTSTTNSTDSGVIRDSVVDGVVVLGYAVNYETTAPTLLEYRHSSSGGIIIHWHNGFIYTSTDDVTLINNIIKYLSSFGADVEEQYEALQEFQQTEDKRYELIGVVQQNLNAVYEALTFVVNDAASLFEALQFIATTEQGNYEALQGDTKITNKHYELLGVVKTDLDSVYEALKYVAQDGEINYSALGLITQNRIKNYESTQGNTVSKDKRYELIGFVITNQEGIYEALFGVEATVDPNYEATVSFFVKTQDLRYELIGFVKQSAIVNYESLLTIAQAQANFESLVGVIVNTLVPYEALGLVVKNQKGQYEVHPFLQQTYVQCSGELKLDVDYNEESCVVTDVDDETNPVNETTGVIEDRETRYSLDGSADTNYTPEAQADTRYTVESRNSPDYTNDVTHTPTFDDEE